MESESEPAGGFVGRGDG